MKITWKQFDLAVDKLARKITSQVDLVFYSIRPLDECEDNILAGLLSEKLNTTVRSDPTEKKTLNVHLCYDEFYLEVRYSLDNAVLLFVPRGYEKMATSYGHMIDNKQKLVMPWQK